MKRVLGTGLILAAAATVALFGLGAGDSNDGDDYLVRAIFHNAGFVIAGEDVKVAGVKVGSIHSLDVTPDNKAVVVLKIDEPGYQDFREDAHCIVRPQSLIGEKFVECEPTQKRAVGAAGAPALKKIDAGVGTGQYLLPVQNTSKSVDIDLLNNTMRLPYRQRFSIILNELGTGLAGRGDDLRTVIRQADPALREIDRVLDILAEQNQTLTQLATNSDEALAPLTRERRRVTSFIEQSAEVAEATAERRADLEADFERLPRFLDELTPTMRALGSFSDQATPVFADLRARAPQINEVIREMGPFARAATPALETLGEATKIGVPALREAQPIVRDLRTFAREVRPVAATLAAVLTSFQKTNGIERFMDYMLYQATAVNGFDSFGHYLRAALLVNTCSNYTTTPIQGCSANFRKPEAEEASASAAAAAVSDDDITLKRTARVLAGEDPQKVLEDTRGAEEPSESRSAAKPKATPTPAPEPEPEATPAPSAPPAAQPSQDALLDYLFGGEGK